MEYAAQSPFDGARVLGQILLVGMAMGVYYDVFRVLRRVLRFSYTAVLAQDVFFFITSALAGFFVCIHLSGGRMRAAYVLAMLAGWAVYAFTVGAVVMFVLDRVIAAVRAAVRLLEKRLKRYRPDADE